MKRALPAAVLAFALVTVTLPASAWHSDLPTVRQISVDGQGAWSVSLEVEEPGDFAIELEGNTSRDATRAGLGAASMDADGDVNGFANLILLSSADRVVVAKEVEQDPTGALDDVSFAESGDSNLEEGFWGVAARESNADAGTHHYGFWMAGMQTVNLTVKADTAVDVAVERGTPYLMGSPDFTGGDANVQAQASLPANEPEGVETPNPGVKHIRNADAQIPVEHRLVGDWIALEPDTACQAVVAGTCVPAHALAEVGARQAEELCHQRTGLDCGEPRQAVDEEREPRISWSGPGADGSSQALWYRFGGAPAGDYTLTIDQSTDAYAGPLVYEEETNTFAALQPVYFLAVLADLPDPPAV
jgi:hypothetical protein